MIRTRIQRPRIHTELPPKSELLVHGPLSTFSKLTCLDILQCVNVSLHALFPSSNLMVEYSG